MDYITIIAIAVGLSFDTFAVSLSFGVVKSKILFRQAVVVAFVLAFFQAGLTVAGYFLGSIVAEWVKAVDHWIALILLGFLGAKMIKEGLSKKEEEEKRDFLNTIVLLTIALGTSIDAFAVGISFAFLDVKIWSAVIIIGIVTFLASMTAIRIGKFTGEKLGSRVEVVGGIILVAIGVKIFLEHTMGF